MKKVLIITYYWYPSGGSGVQRWLKTTKYLDEFGWQPIVYTAENAEYPVIDYSLKDDINPNIIEIKQPIKEPYGAYKKLFRKGKTENVKSGFIKNENESTFQKFKNNIAIWIRGNFFIPDARCLWIKPSVKYLTEYLHNNNIDAIISTGPPHSMHMIALELRKKFNIPWIADFRDPWTKIDFYEQLKLTKLADKKHHKLELEVLQTADKIVTVSNSCAKDLEAICNKKVEVITNGFDTIPKDIEKEKFYKENFVISHIGVLPENRNAPILWKALSELTTENKTFGDKLKIELIGHVDGSILEDIKKLNLNSYLKTTEYIPHDKVIAKQKMASLLLLLINKTKNSKGILTGKLFEYLATFNPILAIGPTDGDVADILSETKAGKIIDYNDKDSIKEYILEIFNNYIYNYNKKDGISSTYSNTNNRINYNYINNNYNNDNSNLILKYSRKELTKEYAKILDSVLENNSSNNNDN